MASTVAMTGPKPRRRWKRWVALALVLLFAGVVWMVSGEGATIRRSRAVRPGMTRAQVHDVLGDPVTSLTIAIGPGSPERVPIHDYATRSEVFVYHCQRDVWHTMRSLGVWESVSPPLLPVSVTFDQSDKVWHIRRGSEIESTHPAVSNSATAN